MSTATPAALREPITNVPVFHWFFVSVLTFGIVQAWGDAWWAVVILGLLWLRLMTWNSTLYFHTEVDSVRGVIHIWRLTLLGPRTSSLSFSEISEVRVAVRTWGDHNSRHERGRLLICTRNHASAVVYSSMDVSGLEALAAQLREVVGLQERQLGLTDVPSLSGEARRAVEARCDEARNGRRFLGPADISPELRQKIEQSSGLAPEEALLLFVDTSLVFKGRYGLVIAERGIYWANDPEMWEHTRIQSLSWSDFASVNLRKDPADQDILVDDTSQMGLGVLEETEEVLELLSSLQALVRAGS